jgi:hypothetical protein
MPLVLATGNAKDADSKKVLLMVHLLNLRHSMHQDDATSENPAIARSAPQQTAPLVNGKWAS